jgi:hypothetical protein
LKPPLGSGGPGGEEAGQLGGYPGIVAYDDGEIGDSSTSPRSGARIASTSWVKKKSTASPSALGLCRTRAFPALATPDVRM